MRKYLYVIHYPIFGGPHNQALRLAGPLRERGWETIVLLPDEPGNAAKRLREADIEVIECPLHRLRATTDPRVQLEFVRNVGKDVQRISDIIVDRDICVVMLGGLINPQAAVAARRTRTPLVWQIVDGRSPRVLRRLLRPVLARWPSVLMFDGQALIPQHLGNRRQRPPVFVYFPPVDTSKFIPSEERGRCTRSGLGIPEEARVVGMVANLNPQKGIEYFIRAAPKILRRCPDTWFITVGARYLTHERYFSFLREELEKSGVPEERFVFAGSHDDVENFYPAFDVKLVTSVRRSEGTTTTALEAMSCGIPVVATDVGAISEVVLHGKTGWLVPPMDPAAMASATLRLLLNDQLRSEMGRAARIYAEETFSVHRCVETHIQVFDTAVSAAR